MRVESNSLPKDNWLHFLRQRDFAQVFGRLERVPCGPILEIGCGDGHVTSLLRNRNEDVVPIDLSPWQPVEDVCVATAEALPFKNGHFSMVYSSNVLEHVDDLPACLEELKRVTKRDALMVHTMPTITWKILQLMLYPAHILLQRALPKIVSPEQHRTSSADNQADTRTISRFHTLWPPVHGVADSHFKEMVQFRSAWWAKRFSAHGLELVRVTNLYFHSAYRLLPYRMLTMRDILGRSGLSTARAYWVKKTL